MFRKYINLCLNLTKDQMFKSLDRNEDRIEFILNLESKQDMRQTMTEQYQSAIGRKSVEKTIELITEGENLLEVDLEEAVTTISRAILNAPHDDQEDGTNLLFRAYSLRSRAFCQMEKYNECIRDIDRALEVSQSNELETERNRVSLLCEDNNDDNNADDIEDEETDLFVDDRCIIDEAPGRGRFMVAERYIGAGEVIIEETAQCKVLNYNNLLSYCSYCLKHIGQNFWPCIECNECVFCDINCAEKAMNEYHSMECGITSYILNRFNTNFLLGYRILTSTGIKAIDELYPYFVEREAFDVREWIGTHNGEKETDESRGEDSWNLFNAFLSFEDHLESANLDQIVVYIFNTLEIALLIDQINVFHLTNDKQFIELTTMLISLNKKVIHNNFRWSTIDEPDVGNCLCLVSTMINHSCDPNVLWIIIDGKQRMEVCSDIDPEDEISISYGIKENDAFIDRQKKLFRHYNFICGCPKCQNQKLLFTALRCLKCESIVYHSTEDPNDKCINCDTKYEYIAIAVQQVQFYSKTFKLMLDLIGDEVETDSSEPLRIADNSIRMLSYFLSSESIQLKKMKADLEDKRQAYLSQLFI